MGTRSGTKIYLKKAMGIMLMMLLMADICILSLNAIAAEEKASYASSKFVSRLMKKQEYLTHFKEEVAPLQVSVLAVRPFLAEDIEEVKAKESIEK